MNEYYTIDKVTIELEAAGFEVFNRSAKDIAIYCPYCPDNDPDTHGKCYITPEALGGIYHCFRCEKAGSIRNLFKDLGIAVVGRPIDTGRLQEKVLRAERAKLFKDDNLPKKLKIVPLPRQYEELVPQLTKSSMMALRAYHWLHRKRGLNWDQIREWKIGFCSSGDYAQHLIMPVFDEEGRTVSFQARRFIGSIKPKSKNPKSLMNEFGREDILYGIHRVRPGDCLVIVEGPFDVYHLQRLFAKLKLRHFKPLGVFGHKLSRTQILKIVRMEPSSTWTMMDADAVKETFKMAQKLSPQMEGPVYAAALEYGDPDDLGVFEMVKILKNSPSISSFPRSGDGVFSGPSTKSETGSGSRG